MKNYKLYTTVKQLFGEVHSIEGIIITFSASIFFAWFPDALKDFMYMLLPFDDRIKLLILLIFSLIILFPLAFLIGRIAKRLKGISYYVEADEDLSSARKVKVILMGLSKPNCSNLEEEIKKVSRIPPEERVKRYIENPEEKCNWIMPVCLIKKLQEAGAKLNKVIIISSDASYSYREKFLSYISLFDIDRTLFEFSEKTVDYEDLNELQRLINEIIKKNRGHRSKRQTCANRYNFGYKDL